jgi:ubiquinone/menaquinone biosynthesis C-methylase UbiE
MKRLMEELAKIQGGRVVDVATRYGEFALKLHGGLCGYSEIIGIDNDPDTVKEAEKRCLGSGISFRVMDARRMDFEDDSLDTVCISNSLHHLTNPREILLEMKRVLRPGGLYIINEMFRDHQTKAQQTHVLLHHLDGEIDTVLGTYHAKTCSKQKLVKLFDTLDMADIKIFEDIETDPVLAQKLAAKVEKIAQKAEKTKGLPQYEEFCSRAAKVRDAFDRYGVKRCTQLVMMGRKR